MRKQYKILAEKYSLVKENDKEDMMAGLNYLTNLNLSRIHMTYVNICRGDLDDIPAIKEVNSDFIHGACYGENEEYYQDFPDALADYFEEVILKLKDNQLVEIDGEEGTYYFSLDVQKIQAKIIDILEQYGVEDGEFDV